MPNGKKLVLPYRLKPGLLSDMVKEAELSVEAFIELL
jgi:hypothetical protein